MTILPFHAAHTRPENKGDAPALLTTPYLIRPNWQFEGTLSDPDDEDWVKVFLPGNSEVGVLVQFQVVGRGTSPLADAKITLYNEQGIEIPHFFPEIDEGFDDHFLFALPEPGNVFASVESQSGATHGAYALQVVTLGVYYEGWPGNEAYNFSPSNGIDLVRTFSGYDQIYTGNGNDIIYAGDGDDDVGTGDGNDLIFGGRGSDLVNTGNDSDTVHAGAGNDKIISGKGDVVIYAGDGNDKVNTTNGKDLIFGGRGSDNLSSGNGNDTVYGGDGNDRLSNESDGTSVHFGERGNDTLVGGGQEGAETMYGGEGNDLLRGQGGADHLHGGAGEDTVTYHDTGAITLSLADQSLNAGAAAGNRLTSIEVIRGSGFDDGMAGNRFRNILSGNDGNDTLGGGQGFDRLTGGAGADTFAFVAGDGIDRITDFHAAEDRLRLMAPGSVAVTQAGGATIIDYGSGDRIILLGVELQQAEISFEVF